MLLEGPLFSYHFSFGLTFMFMESESTHVLIHSEAPSIQLEEQERHIFDVENTLKMRGSLFITFVVALVY